MLHWASCWILTRASKILTPPNRASPTWKPLVFLVENVKNFVVAPLTVLIKSSWSVLCQSFVKNILCALPQNFCTSVWLIVLFLTKTEPKWNVRGVWQIWPLECGATTETDSRKGCTRSLQVLNREQINLFKQKALFEIHQHLFYKRFKTFFDPTAEQHRAFPLHLTNLLRNFTTIFLPQT